MRPRPTMRVMISPEHPDYRLDLFDAKDWLIKWRKITIDGLLHTNDGVIEPGPVTVPATSHYRRLVREGALVLAPQE